MLYVFFVSISISLFSNFSRYSKTFSRALLSVALKNSHEVVFAISCNASKFKGKI
ncbi:MAG: hypothetical protein LBU14_01590 [Candidatus Peribacteria bacterium]|nr:hypothetical protein [Candidatus Peribacteria bacterium]